MTEKHSKTQRHIPYTQYELDTIIYRMLTVLGIPANLKGFKYLNAAISAVYYDPQAGHRIVSGLYARLALENNTAPWCVEHSIRTALLRIRKHGIERKLIRLFGKTFDITPKKLIISAAEKLREDSGLQDMPIDRNAK